jgi:nicotinamidase-related amidase
LARTAIITSECQRGAVGDDALWPELRIAAVPILPNIARILAVSRSAGVPIVHLVAVRRTDMLAASLNAPLFEVSVRKRSLVKGTAAAELVPELGPEPSDLVIEKTHGLGSVRSTGLDNVLRNLGVDTVVVGGVSLNVAIPALAFEAVNLGYRVIVPSDAVAGVPAEFARDVLRHSLSLVATITSTDELIAGL